MRMSACAGHALQKPSPDFGENCSEGPWNLSLEVVPVRTCMLRPSQNLHVTLMVQHAFLPLLRRW